MFHRPRCPTRALRSGAWTFTSLTNFPGTINPAVLTRTVRMRLEPITPQ
jgi:hypothetical protein